MLFMVESKNLRVFRYCSLRITGGMNLIRDSFVTMITGMDLGYIRMKGTTDTEIATRQKNEAGRETSHSRNTPIGYDYLPLIVNRLKTLEPWKIILFGSYAYGTPDHQSDIDLLVVLNSENLPQNFHDNMKNKLLVRKALWELSKNISIDLLVYTKPMYHKFQELGSMFAREISQKGKILYETNNP